MQEKKTFYVYIHLYASGEKHGKPFYVGKGTGTRAYSNSSRNQHWHNVNNKYGRNVFFHSKELTSEQACKIEIDLISQIGIDNLTNKSIGGEKGSLGFKHTKEWKIESSKRMKAENIKRKQSPTYRHPCLGRELSKESREKISNSLKDYRKNISDCKKISVAKKISASLNCIESVKKRSEINTGDKNPMYDRRVFLFKHKSGCLFTGTQYQLSTEKLLNKGNVSSMISGKRKSVSGWSVIENVVS